MSDLGSNNSDIEDSLDKLLDDLDDNVPKATAKAKPLASASKPRAILTREGSSSLEDEPNGSIGDNKSKDTTAKPIPLTFSSGSTKPITNQQKPIGFLPMSNRPKTNPNANLLGNMLFPNETDDKKTIKNLPKFPEPVPTVSSKALDFNSTAKKFPTTATKSDMDWLGIGGTNSTTASPIPTPILPRKSYLPKQNTKGPDPFDSEQHISFNNNYSRKGPNSFSPEDENTSEDPMITALKKMKPVGKQELTDAQFQLPKKPLEKSIFQFNQSVPVDSNSGGSGLPPFLEKLTSGGQSGIQPREIDTVDTSGGGIVDRNQLGATDGTNVTQKKRIVTVRKPIGQSGQGLETRGTLQVPSHIIDEDELKRMSSSLKQLYENQVEMLEKSYKEQMDCLVQSYSRKEDMLKEEIKMIHKDYEERISRMKTELAEADIKSIQYRSNQEYTNLVSSLSNQLKILQTQTEIFTNQQQERQSGGVAVKQFSTNSYSESISDVLDVKLSSFLTTLESTFKIRLGETGQNLSLLNEKLVKRLDESLVQFVNLLKVSNNGEVQLLEKVTAEIKKEILSELSKVQKEQKKLTEALLTGTRTSIAQSVEMKHEDHRKKDKLSGDIRGFRRDLQRLTFDIENKQSSVVKSQVSLEGDQKQIAQSFRDLSTWLQMTFANNLHHFQSSSQPQSSVQNEMELKLLKEERNALSEVIAQGNVDKHRLHDEKLQIEAEKRDFERRQLKIHDLETTLKIKLTDTEDSKKEAEAFRIEHMKLTAELSRKITEIEKEKIRFRDKIQTIEFHTNVQKQRFGEERTELNRERDFLEKLRLQSMCPACLRLVRSDGDGVDHVRKHVPLPLPVQPTVVQASFGNPMYMDIEREGQQLKDIISSYYGGGQDLFRLT